MDTIVNIVPATDHIFVFKACRRACTESCGTCIACRRACKPDCEDGVDSGTGHVWAVSDRLPLDLLQDVLVSYAGMVKVQQSVAAATPLDEAESIATMTAIQSAVLKLMQLSYPDVTAAHLNKFLDWSSYGTILARFFIPRTPSGISGTLTPQTEAKVVAKTRKLTLSSKN